MFVQARRKIIVRLKISGGLYDYEDIVLITPQNAQATLCNGRAVRLRPPHFAWREPITTLFRWSGGV